MDEFIIVTIQVKAKATYLFFPVILFLVLYKMVLTSESFDETQPHNGKKWNHTAGHSGESYLTSWIMWNFYYYYLMCAFSLYFHKYLVRFRQNISFWRLDDKTFKCPALYLPVTDFWSEYAMIGPFICDLVTALFQGNYFWFSFQCEWWKSVTWLRKKAWFLGYSYRRRKLFQRAYAHCSQRRPAQSNGRG